MNSNEPGHSNDSGYLLFFTIISPREGGAYSRDFTIILAMESGPDPEMLLPGGH